MHMVIPTLSSLQMITKTSHLSTLLVLLVLLYSLQYFIGVEQSLLCEYTSLVTALFHLVVVHYVFNIELVVHLTHEVI